MTKGLPIYDFRYQVMYVLTYEHIFDWNLFWFSKAIFSWIKSSHFQVGNWIDMKKNQVCKSKSFGVKIWKIANIFAGFRAILIIPSKKYLQKHKSKTIKKNQALKFWKSVKKLMESLIHLVCFISNEVIEGLVFTFRGGGAGCAGCAPNIWATSKENAIANRKHNKNLHCKFKK